MPKLPPNTELYPEWSNISITAPPLCIEALWHRVAIENKTMSQVVIAALARQGLSVMESLAALGCDRSRRGQPAKCVDQFSVHIPITLLALLRARARAERRTVRSVVLLALQADGLPIDGGEIDRRSRRNPIRVQQPCGRLIDARLRVATLMTDRDTALSVRNQSAADGMITFLARGLTRYGLCSSIAWHDVPKGHVFVSRHHDHGRIVLVMPELAWHEIVQTAQLTNTTEKRVLLNALSASGLTAVHALSDARLRSCDGVRTAHGGFKVLPMRGRRAQASNRKLQALARRKALAAVVKPKTDEASVLLKTLRATLSSQ